MSSLVSFHLDNVEYNADRIARLFPKCKPKTFVHGNIEDNQTCSTIDINRNSLTASNENDDDYRPLMDVDNNTMHDANVIDMTTSEKSTNEKNTGCNGNINNALSADNDSSCSRASSPFDISAEDDDSEEVVSSPRSNLPPASDVSNISSQHHQPDAGYHPHHHPHHYRSSHFHHPLSKRKMHRVQSAVNQYKLRDSRIIEIAGGRELFSQSRSKACRKPRVHEPEKAKSPGRVWELRARMSEDKKQESSKEITETVFSSEIKSVKHPQTISLGINGSVIFDDIDEDWKSDNPAIHIPKRTYQTNSSTHNNSDKESKMEVCDEVDVGESSDGSTWDTNKITPALHVIGSLPIAEYEGSPRRYGLRTSESVIPTLLSSPTFSMPRPGFPQRIVDESSVPSSSAAISSVPPTSSTSFNYLYEYSETRKVLEEFFKPDDAQEKIKQPFRELEYELKRRRKLSLDQGNSYVALRLAEGTDGNTYSSPKKNSQDSSEYSNSHEPGFLSNYTVSTENLGLPLEFQITNNDKNAVHHSRYSISPDLERCFRQSRNFTLSPETTDCESNFGEGEGDSDVSSLLMVTDSDAPTCPPPAANGPSVDRLYPSMPILEDGLSSGHTSDNENNNATVLLMKKQISEIEREITEKSNRPISMTAVMNNASVSTSSSSETTTTTMAVTTSASSLSPSTFKPGLVVPSINLSSQNNPSCANPMIIESRPTDIDLELLDPLASVMDRHASSSPPPPAPAPHREFQQRLVISNQNAGTVEDTIKDIRMTLQRTKTLPLRPLCVTNSGDNEDHESSNSVKSETPIWIPRRKGAGSGPSGDEDDLDTDLETDRLLGQQRNDDQGFFDENTEKENAKKKNRNKEGLTDPSVLIEGVLFRARYLGSTQLVCEGQPTKATRMMQAEEAVSRIKAPEGETQPSTEVDLFISTEKIMVLNTDLKEIMMDHALRTISYIADIGDLVVLMARRRFVPHDIEDPPKISRTPKMICHVFESDEAQFIAQSIGQAFQVAYMEFLKANGIEDHSFVKEMDYQEVLNSQEIFGDELQMFAKKELQKEVVVPKMKGEILGVVIVESGWGSMLPTVVIANLAPAGAAARCGQLNIGDQIIAVNGVSLVGLPLSTCQNYIKNSKPHNVVKLTVVPCAPVVEVKIKRPDTKYQLGFSVQNGVICSLLRGGIAERGGVRVGHRIIEINNQSVVAVPHEKIVTLLATSVGEILMKTMPTSMFRLLTGQETPIFI